MRLSVRGLTLGYGRRVVVHGLDLTAEPGTVLALLGANGSGKSTLLRGLAGLMPSGGSVAWDGAPAAPGSIGYMPQDNVVRAGLSAFEVVLLGRLRSLNFRVGAEDLQMARAAMAELAIDGLAEQRIGELSGGQRQLVFLAQVLAGNPRALLLDEPTSALDIAHQLQVLELLRITTRRRGLTTVIVLHDLNAAARFADRIALLQAGRLIAHGTPSEVLRPPMLEPAYDVHVAVDPGSDGHPVVLPLRVRRPDGDHVIAGA